MHAPSQGGGVGVSGDGDGMGWLVGCPFCF